MDLGTGSIEQVRQSAPKIDMELGAIYGHLNNIRTRYRSATAPSNPEAGQQWENTVNAKVMKWNGSAWVEDIAKSLTLTNRNTVLQGQVSSVGALELILGSTSALTADLVSSAIETIITIPAGHDATTGNSDYIVSFTATQTAFWSSLPTRTTSYLFVDYNAGTVTGTYTVVLPVFQSFAPAHASGKHWYDTNKEQWYVSDGSSWVAKYRVYVGSVVTDGTKTTATTILPYNAIRSDLIGNADTATTSTNGYNAGDIIFVAKNSPPPGFLKANGAAISRTTYSALFSAIGTTFGTGDGSTTFNIPDLRGEFIRGWADDRAVDTGRVFGSAQADEIKSHTHTVPISTTTVVWNYGNGGALVGSGYTSGATGGTETRPRNVTLLACIKY